MRAEELRFGNWFSYRGCFEYQVTALLELSVEFLHTNNKHYFRDYTDIDPIPLTREWITKFGFKDNQIEIKNKYVYFCIDIDDIKYVHELQNLYFALTGEELEINR